jgi:amino acid adenylation domain-containing protein
MLVQDFLETTAARIPDKVALVCGDKRFTYAEIDAMANRLAAALGVMGVRRGDRVAIFQTNSVTCVVAIFAVLKAGGVFVVVNSSTKRDKLIYILNNCDATVLVTEPRMLFGETPEALRAAVATLRGIVLIRETPGEAAGTDQCVRFFDAIQTEFSSACLPRLNVDCDLACLIYTSGTTGEPKGVACDHASMVFVADSVIQYLQNVESDVVMNVLPLSFSYGLYQILMTFKFGGTVVLEKSFAYPALVLKLMEREGVTGFPGVPTLFASLLRCDLSQYDLSRLRYLTNAAAALPVQHIKELRLRFPSCAFYSMYGQTETKRTLYLPPDQVDKRPDSVGIAIPGTEVWIEDESGQRLGAREVGELVVRGRHVMRGYWNAPEASARRFRQGRNARERLCYTGDLFRMDDEGFFYFVSRKDDIIKSRGEKVAPKEVENVLYSLKGVVEAVVVGVPDPVIGQAIKAVIVPNGVPLSEAQVLAHCRANLEDFMVPKCVEFRTELPRTPTGKVRRSELV